MTIDCMGSKVYFRYWKLAQLERERIKHDLLMKEWGLWLSR